MGDNNKRRYAATMNISVFSFFRAKFLGCYVLPYNVYYIS